MSTVYLVRHGQASFMQDDYDRLSPVGHQQATALGRYWAQLELTFDRVIVGALRRHRETEAGVAAAYYEKGLPWPEVEEWPAFKEHQGPEVTQFVLTELVNEYPELQRLVRDLDTESNQRHYLKAFQKVMRMWARQEINPSQFESWVSFRTRVEEGVKKLMATERRGQKVAVFTSGGPVAVTTGFALSLPDEKIMELSWEIRNATVSEFRFSGTRFSLSSFNAAPHLSRRELWTYV